MYMLGPHPGSKSRSKAWVWAAVLKGELEVVSHQSRAGSSIQEWSSSLNTKGQIGFESQLGGTRNDCERTETWTTLARYAPEGCLSLRVGAGAPS